MRYHQEEFKIAKELHEDLTQKNRIEEDLCFPFVNRQFSIFSKILSPIIHLVKNQSKEKYLSYANGNLYVFSAKGALKPKQVDEATLQTILLSDITNIIKKDAYLNNIRAQKFTITHKGGVVKGFITIMKARQMLKQIEDKLPQ